MVENDGKTVELDQNPSVSLCDLAWDDVLFVHILPTLSWEDLFRLRRASTSCLKLVDSYWSQMKCVNFSKVEDQFTSTAFRAVTENCTNVRHLLISGAKWIRDGDLTPVFRANKALTYVDLSRCSNLNGSCLLALSVNCKVLRTLFLQGCTWVWRGALETLIAHLKKLQEVDFTSCVSLCSTQITHFSQAFPRLTRLHLGHIPSVNDSTLIALARNCPKLKLLDIQACRSVTDHGIRAVAQYCLHLEVLKVAHCNLITEVSLSLLRSRATVTIDRPVGPLPFLHQFPPLQLQV